MSEVSLSLYDIVMMGRGKRVVAHEGQSEDGSDSP